MQSLVDQHGAKVVLGGAFAGSQFGQLNNDQLRRAAKRYPSDLRLQKFAKARVAIMELELGDDPLPCAPLRVAPVPQQLSPLPNVRGICFSSFKKWAILFLTKSYFRLALCALVLALLFKPAVSTVLAKYTIWLVRALVRQLFQFVISLLEGVVDEVIYQLEYAMRDALPPHVDFKDLPRAPIQVLSHLISAVFGASLTILSSALRARQAQVAI